MKSKFWSPSELYNLYQSQEQLSALDQYALQAARWAKGRLNNYNDNQTKQYDGSVTFDGKHFTVTLDGKQEVVPFNYEDLLPLLQKQGIEESSSKLYLVTTKDGKKKYTASLTDQARAELVSKGAQVEDPATGANDTSSVMSEEIVKPTKNDILNLAKQLQSVVDNTLRSHGDDVAFTTPKLNKKSGYIIIYVNYQKDIQDPGAPSEDRFTFEIADGKVMLVDAGEKYDVCPIGIQSGTVHINQDLAKDAILKFIGNATVDECSEGNLDEFKKAVDAYKANRSKETIKELFKASRGFEGNDIQHKLQNAVQTYKASLPGGGMEVVAVDDEPVESPSDYRAEEGMQQDANLSIGYSLLLKMFEWAKEDAKQDEDLHFAIEKIGQLNRDKGTATMDDFEFIVSHEEQPQDNKLSDDSVDNEDDQNKDDKE